MKKHILYDSINTKKIESPSTVFEFRIVFEVENGKFCVGYFLVLSVFHFLIQERVLHV